VETDLDSTPFENSITGLQETGELSKQAITFLNMATLHFLTDNLDEAETCIQQALSSDSSPGSEGVAYSLVYLHLRKGSFASALKVLKKRRVEASTSEADLEIC